MVDIDRCYHVPGNGNYFYTVNNGKIKEKINSDTVVVSQVMQTKWHQVWNGRIAPINHDFFKESF